MMVRVSRGSLLGDFRWTGAGVAVYALSQMLLVVGIVRLEGIEGFGTWAYATAVVTPITLLGGLKLRSIVATDASEAAPIRTYRRLALLGAVAAVSAIAVCSQVPTLSRGAGSLMLIVGVARALDGITDVELGWLQRQFRFRRITACSVLAAASAALTVVVIAISGDLVVGGLTTLAGSVATFLYARNPSRGVVHTGTEGDADPGVFVMGARVLPMSAANGLSMLTVALPRLMLEWFVGRGAVGAYASIQSLLSTAGLPVTALAQAASPRLALLVHERAGGDLVRLVRQLCGASALVAAILVTGTLLVGPEVASIVYGDDFAPFATTMFLLSLSIGVAITSSILGTTANALRAFRQQLVLSGLVFSCCLVLLLVLVPAWGVNGAAGAALAATSLQACLYAFLLKRETRLIAGVSNDLVRHIK